jgi:hypothetical protein
MVGISTSAGISEHLEHLEGSMAELQLLLPEALAHALEREALRRGLSSAQLTRRLIATFLATAPNYLSRAEGAAAAPPA